MSAFACVCVCACGVVFLCVLFCCPYFYFCIYLTSLFLPAHITYGSFSAGCERDGRAVYLLRFGLRIEMCLWVSEPHELVNDSV